MTRDELVNFIRRHPLAVQTSVSASGAPQAAVVGIVVSDDLHVFFDTLKTSRKCDNLRRDLRIALVIGWDLEQACTLQLEGVADEPFGSELEQLKQLYFERFPDGVESERSPDITYIRVRPTWLRFSDFRGKEPAIVELRAEALR